MLRRELKTKRLLLRPYRKDDAPALALNANDYDVARMTGRIPHPYTLAHAREHIARQKEDWAKGAAYGFGIFRGGTHVGGAGLFLGAISKTEKPWELGYWIAGLFWGFGYASEAADEMLRFAFADLKLKKVFAGHFADNPASGRVLAKLGFRHLYDAEIASLARGATALSHEMEVTREDWQKARMRA